MRHTLLLFLLLPGFSIAQAQPLDEEHAHQKFIHYVEPLGLVLIESVEPGMTLYHLSRTYNVGIDSLLAANPDLDPHAIPLGYPVNIPIYPQAILFHVPTEEEQGIPIYYRIQPKETLYRISKTYLNVSPETILSLNPLATSNLAIGQVLLIGWYQAVRNTYNPVEALTNQATSIVDSTMYRIRDYAEEYKAQGQVIKEQKGLAVWKPGNDKTHYFVLHPTAKIGSYMEITNPMLHRTLTAKVAGNIPSGLYPARVGLVVSPSVARALGVLDQQFFARWRFVE